MKVAIYQTSPVLLDLKANLEQIVAKIHEGREKGAQLVIFPELALTGYFVGKRYHEAALRLDSDEIRQLAAASRGTATVVGFIEESPAMNFYNSALVAVDGNIRFAYRKLNLPNYGSFEERKYFSPGKQVPVFKLHDFTIAVFICNDLWHPALPYLAVCQKADIFVTISNSCEESMGSDFSNRQSWQVINKFYSRVFGVYNISANRAGVEVWKESRSIVAVEIAQTASGETSEETFQPQRYRFWGGSEIINPYGHPDAKAGLYEVDEIFGEISRDLLRRKRIRLPYLRNDDPYFTHRELQRILFGKPRDYVS
jgi:predicted amidohydrolase